MTDKLNLVLIFGGRSGEHAVSLRSAQSVLAALDETKYQVFQVGITTEGLWLYGANAHKAFRDGSFELLQEALILSDGGKPYLYAREGNQLESITPIDVIFPVLHGTFGEDGTIQGLFEIQNCAYVGAGVLGSSVAMDKAVCKHVMRSIGVPVLEYAVFSRREVQADLAETIAFAEQVAAYPLFVKPANLGSSVGISKARNREELTRALQLAARFDRRILVERGINPREIEISVLGNTEAQCTVPGEIVPGDEFYTYKDKYQSGDPEVAIPAPLPEAQTALLQQYAIDAFKAVDGAGLARVDFLIDKVSGEVYFNEINTMPGFTEISMYPKLWLYSGLSYTELVNRLIELALERKAEQDETIRKFEE
jgi:D-alanine--D-alanine ligase (EC 6.3.2.4)